MDQLQLVASTAFGLESVVSRELQDLGYEPLGREDGRILFEGPPSAICRTNMWLRSCDRIGLVIGNFTARDFDELFDQIAELPWEEWIGVDDQFPVTANVVRSSIRSAVNTQKMVKRAIVERLRKKYTRHWFQESGAEYRVNCDILRDDVLLTIDTTGPGLHRRGYRRDAGEAPLRETLAAALVQLSYWQPGRFLIDPFCGSGTIPIEAAMMGRKLAPGRNRVFTAMDWRNISQDLWKEAQTEARDLALPKLPGQVSGSDIDKRAITQAWRNANDAGVGGDLQFSVRDFVEMPSNRDYGIMIANPPYGERMGDRDAVRKMHQDMGELYSMLDTWSYYILTSALFFEKQFGRPADRRRKLFNGQIECTYYQYLGPRPPEDFDHESEPGSSDDEAAS
ncbi:MAG: class I SAM-dependent RNA methyltransferase [Planctomycetaceae bacterium]